jgi:hypothetical protein
MGWKEKGVAVARIVVHLRVVLVAFLVIVGLATTTSVSLADNTVTGSLAVSPNYYTPIFDMWAFVGPSNGSTVTLTLTYSPSYNDFDSKVGFNVYGDDGTLFGQGVLVASGTKRWSFQSTSRHQYAVQVFNYDLAGGVTYSLAAKGVDLVKPVTPTPTPTPSPIPIAPAPTVAPVAPSTSIPTPTPVPISGSLAGPGSPVHGHLVGSLTGAVADYRLPNTPTGSSITLELSAVQGSLISGAQAGVNVYQVQGSVRVLVAVGLPSVTNSAVSELTFQVGNSAYGAYVAEVYNGAPGAALDYTLTRR